MHYAPSAPPTRRSSAHTSPGRLSMPRRISEIAAATASSGKQLRPVRPPEEQEESESSLTPPEGDRYASTQAMQRQKSAPRKSAARAAPAAAPDSSPRVSVFASTTPRDLKAPSGGARRDGGAAGGQPSPRRSERAGRTSTASTKEAAAAHPRSGAASPAATPRSSLSRPRSSGAPAETSPAPDKVQHAGLPPSVDRRVDPPPGGARERRPSVTSPREGAHHPSPPSIGAPASARTSPRRSVAASSREAAGGGAPEQQTPRKSRVILDAPGAPPAFTSGEVAHRPQRRMSTGALVGQGPQPLPLSPGAAGDSYYRLKRGSFLLRSAQGRPDAPDERRPGAAEAGAGEGARRLERRMSTGAKIPTSPAAEDAQAGVNAQSALAKRNSRSLALLSTSSAGALAGSGGAI